MSHFIPEDLKITADCGCFRVGSMPEVRCEGHKHEKKNQVVLAAELRAIEEHKDRYQHIACLTLGCLHRSDEGKGKEGYCEKCIKEREDSESWMLEEVPFPR